MKKQQKNSIEQTHRLTQNSIKKEFRLFHQARFEQIKNSRLKFQRCFNGKSFLCRAANFIKLQQQKCVKQHEQIGSNIQSQFEKFIETTNLAILKLENPYLCIQSLIYFSKTNKYVSVFPRLKNAKPMNLSFIFENQFFQNSHQNTKRMTELQDQGQKALIFSKLSQTKQGTLIFKYEKISSTVQYNSFVILRALNMFLKQKVNNTKRDQLMDLAMDLKVSQFNKKDLYRFGHWTQKQTLKHFLFIYHHRGKFESKSMRKSLRVFKLMSQFLKTRNPSQCRTHHQKILGIEGDVQSALKLYIKEHPSFLHQYEKVKATLQILQDFDFCEDNTYNKKELKVKTFLKEKEQEQYEEEEKNEVKVEEQSEIQAQKFQKMNMFATVPNYPEEQMMNPGFFKQWKSCHELFLKWVNKLQYLMQTQSQ